MTESSTVTPPSFPARCLYYVATGTASVKGRGVGALAHCTHLNQPAYYFFLFYNLTVKRTVMKWNYCDFAIPVSPHSPIFSFRRFSMINVFWSRGKVAMELCDSKEEWSSVCAVYWLKKIGSSTAKKSHEQWQVFIKFDVRLYQTI